MLGACASGAAPDITAFSAPETAVSYEVSLSGLPDDEMTALAEEALSVYRQRDKGAMSLAFLKRRARGDIAVLRKLLRSRGYYRGSVDIEVARTGPGEADGERLAEVRITVQPGRRFTLEHHGFVLDDPSGTARLPDATAFGSPVGAPASAAAIVDAETAVVDRLTRTGFPYAKRVDRDALADIEAATLRVDTVVATGPASTFGTVAYSGLEDVRARYLQTYIPWAEGETFDVARVLAFKRALVATDLFSTVTVKPPAKPPANPGPAPLPLTVEVEERPFRTVSAGVRFSTDEGPSVTGGFEHRNLWGENETIRLEAEAGTTLQRLAAGYREPQYLRNGQDLTASLTFKREEDDAFDHLGTTATVGLQRRLDRYWLVGAGGLLEASLVTDEGVERAVFLAGLPLFAEYDSTDDALNPAKGYRLDLKVTPFAGTFDGDFSGFLTVDATASTYFDVAGDGKWVFAGRGRLASIVTDGVASVPATRRLYSGGGGSVRGFAHRFVGPLDARNDPVGGLSAVELGAEIRARIWGDIGGVLFAEAGSVGVEGFPDFNEGVQFAAGFGLRYFSPAGPIRVDLAFPLNGRDADDAFQLYFSIGQAF